VLGLMAALNATGPCQPYRAPSAKGRAMMSRERDGGQKKRPQREPNAGAEWPQREPNAGAEWGSSSVCP
jgi:hypothetical protein